MNRRASGIDIVMETVLRATGFVHVMLRFAVIVGWIILLWIFRRSHGGWVAKTA
jgi:hypothetical protein